MNLKQFNELPLHEQVNLIEQLEEIHDYHQDEWECRIYKAWGFFICLTIYHAPNHLKYVYKILAAKSRNELTTVFLLKYPKKPSLGARLLKWLTFKKS